MSPSRFDRKELVFMNHSRLFAILLFVLFAAFQSDAARAQIATFYYIGPEFRLSDCEGGGYGVPPCVGTGFMTVNRR
jgi:hypothetical protein